MVDNRLHSTLLKQHMTETLQLGQGLFLYKKWQVLKRSVEEKDRFNFAYTLSWLGCYLRRLSRILMARKDLRTFKNLEYIRKLRRLTKNCQLGSKHS